MRVLISELPCDPLAAIARHVCPNFAELSDSLGDIAGERVGDWIRDAVVAVMGGQGDAFLDSQWLLEWEGWEDLRATLLTHDAAADADEADTIFRAISRHVRQLFMIAARATRMCRSNLTRIGCRSLHCLASSAGREWFMGASTAWEIACCSLWFPRMKYTSV